MVVCGVVEERPEEARREKHEYFPRCTRQYIFGREEVHIGTLVDDQGRMRMVKVREFYLSFEIVNNLLYWSSK